MCSIGMEERLRQTIVILRKLTQELGLPYQSSEVQAVKSCLDQWVRNGLDGKEEIPFLAWDRVAVLEMKKNTVELTLKSTRKYRGK